MRKFYSLVTLLFTIAISFAQMNKNGIYNEAKVQVSANGKQNNGLKSAEYRNFGEVANVMGGCGSVTAFNCGDDATGLSTIGEGNGLDSTDCQPGFDLSGGEDYYFSVTATDASTTQISVCFENWVDDDTYAELLLLGTSCATGYATGCMQSAQWTTPQNGMGAGTGGGFNSGTDNCAFFSVAGPGTYYFVLDSQGDGVTSFDIGNNGTAGIECATSTFSLDGGCNANDADNDGIATSINGTYTTTQQSLTPGQTYTVCTDLYLQNTGWEWLDNVDVSLGSCWTSVTNITPNGTGNDYHSSSGGDWAGSYDATNGEVNWSFTNNSNSTWGDGDTDNYTCYLYSFCFDGTIDAACTNPAGGTFSITCTDDGIGGNGATLTGVINSTEDTSEVIIGVPLLIDFSKINGYAAESSNIVEWTVSEETDMDRYVIYRSIDGENFSALSSIKSKNENYTTNKYIFADNHPIRKTYYRIKQIDNDKNWGYSEVISVTNYNVKSRQVVARYNLLGETVKEDYNGVFLEVYNDGEVKKVLGGKF